MVTVENNDIHKHLKVEPEIYYIIVRNIDVDNRHNENAMVAEDENEDQKDHDNIANSNDIEDH